MSKNAAQTPTGESTALPCSAETSRTASATAHVRHHPPKTASTSQDGSAVSVVATSPPKSSPNRSQTAVGDPRQNNTFGAVAERVKANGFVVMPVKGKAPFISSFNEFWKKQPSVATVRKWAKQHGAENTGLCLGDLVALDIDIDDEERAQEVRALVTSRLGPSSFVRIGREPRCALLYRISRLQAESVPVSCSVGTGTMGKVELLGAGRQLVIFGEHPEALVPYRWPELSPLGNGVADVPVTDIEALDRLMLELGRYLEQAASITAQPHEVHELPRRYTVDYQPEIGERDKYLFWFAREEAPNASSLKDLELAVLDRNAGIPSPLSTKQAKEKAKSAWRLKEQGSLWRSGTKSPLIMPAPRETLEAKAKGLSSAACKLYLVLAATRYSRADFAIAQQATAEALNMGKPTVVRAIAELISSGLLEDTGGTRRVAQRHRPAKLYRFPAQ